MSDVSFKVGGSQYVNNLINNAKTSGKNEITVSGNWEIDEAIRIPSNFTVNLVDCHLRLKDGSVCNVFVNEHNETKIGTTKEGTDVNINVIGKGRAILDGGKPNGLNEKVPKEERIAPLYKNNLILFTNVNGFKISGIQCYNQRWWALNFVYCVNGYIGNIEFRANDTAIDKDGNEYHTLSWDKYDDVLVKNADGVDIRQGCNNILIENLTGFTEDDSVALTGLDGFEKDFKVQGLPSDIAFITIKNIKTSAFCTNVRLLNQGEIKLHDIFIDGVYDDSKNCSSLQSGLYAVRVGDTHLYGKRHSTKEETYNITIKNVYGAGRYAVALAGEIGNLQMFDIKYGENTKEILDQRH